MALASLRASLLTPATPSLGVCCAAAAAPAAAPALAARAASARAAAAAAGSKRAGSSSKPSADMMPSAPVAARLAATSAAQRTLPLASTGKLPSARFTAAIWSRCAGPSRLGVGGRR